ncbi:MAG: hypothetical protein RIR26_2600, partial [Pseudomonadota bacterium]
LELAQGNRERVYQNNPRSSRKIEKSQSQKFGYS